MNCVPASRSTCSMNAVWRPRRSAATGTLARASSCAASAATDIDLGAIRATDVIGFVRREAPRLRPRGLKHVVSGLRAFLRYAEYRGEINGALISAVPAVAAWTATPPLPRAISAEHARRVIASCDLRHFRRSAGPCRSAAAGTPGLARRRGPRLAAGGHRLGRWPSARARQERPPVPDAAAGRCRRSHRRLPASRPTCKSGSPCVPAHARASSMSATRLRCHRVPRAQRDRTSRRRRAAQGITPVPACPGGWDAARRRVVARDR